MAKGNKPTGDKPTGEDKPPVFGDDGKWTKCPEPAAVENGNVKCKKDTCMLKCAEGFMADGSAKTKAGFTYFRFISGLFPFLIYCIICIMKPAESA